MSFQVCTKRPRRFATEKEALAFAGYVHKISGHIVAVEKVCHPVNSQWVD